MIEFIIRQRRSFSRYSRSDILTLVCNGYDWRLDWLMDDLIVIHNHQIRENSGIMSEEASRQLAKLEIALGKTFRKWSIIWIEHIKSGKEIDMKKLFILVQAVQRVLPNIYVPKCLADQIMIHKLRTFEN